MRQSISKKDWDELSEEELEDWSKDWRMRNKIAPFKPNIGEIIEFLGDGLKEITNLKSGYRAWVKFKSGDFDAAFEGEELIDALWKSCKHKLKQ